MGNVRASIAMSANAPGQRPRPRPLGVEAGTVNKVPSPDFAETVQEALRAASGAAAMGMVAEVRVIMVPADLPNVNQ